SVLSISHILLLYSSLLFFLLKIRHPPRSTLSLHDALPISRFLRRRKTVRRTRAHIRYLSRLPPLRQPVHGVSRRRRLRALRLRPDRKSTRLNSSHGSISYAVFCLKKKNTQIRKDSLTEEVH